MRIIVLIKYVPDTSSVLSVGQDHKSIITDDLEYIINPYDEYALEEAVRVKESHGAEVVAVSMGSEQSEKCLRQALANGADRALWVQLPDLNWVPPRLAAKILASVIGELTPDLIFAGKRAVDDDASQFPERIAEALQIPHVSGVMAFALDGRRVTVDCQLEEGQSTIETSLPALFTADKGLNVPRYPKLPDILKAKRKTIEVISHDHYSSVIDADTQGMEILSLDLQPQQRSGTIFEGEAVPQVRQLLTELNRGGLV